MRIEVHHLQLAGGGYQHVATVHAPDETDRDAALEFAWRWTQNIRDSWSLPGGHDHSPAVIVTVPLNGRGLRSSMVGDRFVTPGAVYTVASFGFEEAGAVNAQD